MREDVWRPGAGGVMLFQPSMVDLRGVREAFSRLSVDVEAESFTEVRSRDEEDLRGPSSEQRHGPEAGIYANAENEDTRCGSRDTSPSTLSASSEPIVFTPTDSDSERSPTMPSWEEIFEEQLKTYAADALSSAHTTPVSSPNPSISSVYESDRTDFLRHSETLCPRRAQTFSTRATLSHYWANNTYIAQTNTSVRRRLWGPATTRKRVKTRALKRKTENDKLRDIERNPPRSWSFADRELLCVIYRWFKPATATAIPAVFRALTGSQSSDAAIRTQWDGHCLTYGPKAIPEYAKVFNCSFSDPGDYYRHLVRIIEHQAQQLGVALTRRESEPTFDAGRAVRSKSGSVRRTYKALCRRASQNPAGDVGWLTRRAIPVLNPLGSTTLATAEQYDEFEDYVDVEESPASTQDSVSPSSQPASDRALGFRVFDQNSGTVFKDGAFAASFFADRRNGVTRPLPRNDEYSIFDVIAQAHLSFENRHGSFLVSVSTSLLDVMRKSTSKDRPMLALIDLKTLSQEPNKVHLSGPIIRHLKYDLGELEWTKYRGTCERLVWGDVPASSILKVFPLSDLEHVCASIPTVSKLMRLEQLSQGSSTPEVSQCMEADNLLLNRETVNAMAEIARVFGLNGERVGSAHIADFVTVTCLLSNPPPGNMLRKNRTNSLQCLIDGWHIKATATNPHIMSHLGTQFTMSLRSRNRSLHLQDGIAAFLDGCQRGFENIERFARRRTGTGRKRTA
ncbi:hypothetical protein K458DRAFT_3619 [Lentithecium fluviatile CBS 122367]|uniref:DUF7587 domain-containing protein n=1 Tax=Lentithecium fluviatile CBS 122367 TaxID=1168545 RepID=A0A6G1JNB0_9PLEO|nr:hypothetical protein K458DRAFT_3619 [Lentithecium fluviatile CBS 122367]